MDLRTNTATPFAPSGANISGYTHINIGNSAIKILEKNDKRIFLEFHNPVVTGSSGVVWLGFNNNTTEGITGINFSFINRNQYKVYENITSEIWAINGSSGFMADLRLYELLA